MKRRTFLRATGTLTATAMVPRAGLRRLPPPAPRLEWWREARVGMFIHWGLYSILAGRWGGRDDYAEWIRNNAHIPIAEYDTLVGQFNPTRFDADRWIGMAKDAGAKYVTITTKHHDGFCLFDSTRTDFCVRSTPFKRDILAELAAASRRAGVHQCWYHSIMDWHHPDYLPRRDWEAESRPVDGARFSRYLAYLHAQVTELLTNYGDIGVMWFDGNWEGTWTHEMGKALYEKCRSLQSGVIVNNRVEGWSGDRITAPLGDFRTPEQEVPATGWPGVDWESCITMNDNWGYNAQDHHFKSAEALIGLLVETASKGGNLLLNVGPRADGTFPDESVDRLAAIGRWMRVNGTAVYGSTASPFPQTPFRVTSQARRLNLFLKDWSPAVELPGLQTPIARAYCLSDQSRAPLAVSGTRVNLPARAPGGSWPVVVVEFDTTPIVR